MQEDQNISYIVKEKSGRLSQIDFMQVKISSLMFRALNNKRRQSILKLLEDRGKLTVTQIYVTFRVEQSIISQHLAILRRSGIVETRREGKNIFYLLNDQRLEQINSFVDCLVEK